MLEKAVATHVQDHLQPASLSENLQSGICSSHMTETALLRVTNDLQVEADADADPSLIILLDLTAAFHTLDQRILH